MNTSARTICSTHVGANSKLTGQYSVGVNTKQAKSLTQRPLSPTDLERNAAVSDSITALARPTQEQTLIFCGPVFFS